MQPATNTVKEWVDLRSSLNSGVVYWNRLLFVQYILNWMLVAQK